MGRPALAEKPVWWLSVAILAGAALAVLAFVVMTMRVRLPFWGEAEVLFEASRVRQGFPLFVDPLVGAHEYGAPPSRYYVTYPPLVSYVLAVVPSSAALVAGRLAASLAWFGSLGFIATTAARACRANAIAAAVYIAGIWILANFAMTGRPDSFACAFAAIGLLRAVQRGRIDLLSAACLVLAPWLKPTLLGLPVGAFMADAVIRRSGRMLALAGVLAVGIGAVLFLASHGAIFEHVIRSNAQPFTFDGWLVRMRHLVVFAPLFILATWHGVLGRKNGGLAIGLWATAAAIAWTIVAMAKTGSSSNYWMEPCIASLVLVAHAPGPYVFGRSGCLHAAVTLAAVIYTAVGSISGSIDHLALYRHEAAVVASIRSRCGASPSDVIASDEQGIELAIDGRILTTAYQMLWLVHAGKFPAPLYVDDLNAPNVRCFVAHSGALAVAPEVKSAVYKYFRPLFADGSLTVLVRR